MVMEVVHEDMGEGSMVCSDHPYKNSTPGGICAFCLQEKLGKLVSSSFPVAIFPSSSSSSSPPSRSDVGGGAAASSVSQLRHHASSTFANNPCDYKNGYYSRRSRLPFILTQRRRKKKDSVNGNAGSDATGVVFKRSKSTATPRRNIHVLDENYADDYSPHRRGFWSFLYMSRQHKKADKDSSYASAATPSNVSTVGSSSSVGMIRSRDRKREEILVVDENESPEQAAFDRKVSRSRSVGCGSRSFSGDFFERISTGFGDCTLRRVESQREGKAKMASMHNRNGGQDCIKERVRCGGIFSGFMMTSSSSSSSSSSYWVSSSAEPENVANGKSGAGHISHGRSRSWGWAFASPMRAFTKQPSSSSGRRDSSANKNAVPNLAATPSLLAVSG